MKKHYSNFEIRTIAAIETEPRNNIFVLTLHKINMQSKIMHVSKTKLLLRLNHEGDLRKIIRKNWK